MKSSGTDIMLTTSLFSCKISLTAWHIVNHFLKLNAPQHRGPNFPICHPEFVINKLYKTD